MSYATHGALGVLGVVLGADSLLVVTQHLTGVYVVEDAALVVLLHLSLLRETKFRVA